MECSASNGYLYNPDTCDDITTMYDYMRSANYPLGGYHLGLVARSIDKNSARARPDDVIVNS